MRGTLAGNLVTRRPNRRNLAKSFHEGANLGRLDGQARSNALPLAGTLKVALGAVVTIMNAPPIRPWMAFKGITWIFFELFAILTVIINPIPTGQPLDISPFKEVNLSAERMGRITTAMQVTPKRIVQLIKAELKAAEAEMDDASEEYLLDLFDISKFRKDLVGSYL
jgi:hypothetical protein